MDVYAGGAAVAAARPRVRHRRTGTNRHRRGPPRQAFGMEVLFYDPYKADGCDKSLGVHRVETLDEILARSFVLSLHCPLSEETRHLINAQSIARMQAGSYLINTARGAVVDTTALPEAIACGKLAGAGMNVLEHEPPSPDHPLLAAWRDPGHPGTIA